MALDAAGRKSTYGGHRCVSRVPLPQGLSRIYDGRGTWEQNGSASEAYSTHPHTLSARFAPVSVKLLASSFVMAVPP